MLLSALLLLAHCIYLLVHIGLDQTQTSFTVLRLLLVSKGLWDFFSLIKKGLCPLLLLLEYQEELRLKKWSVILGIHSCLLPSGPNSLSTYGVPRRNTSTVPAFLRLLTRLSG